jgi:uncharacterized membrane protein YhaH (DUF805 family)
VERLIGYFSFRGRTSRAPFWVTSVAIGLIVFVGSNLAGMLGRYSAAAGLAVQIAFTPLLVAYLAVAVRRLHDRNRTGWWMLLYGFAPGFLSGLAWGGLTAGNLKETSALAILVIAICVAVWALVELGVLKGTTGANRFGPDPLAPQGVSAAASP